MTRRRSLITQSVLLASNIALVPVTAHAAERQHRVGLDPSLAMLKVGDKSTWSIGAGLALDYTYGIDDQFNLLVEAGHAIVALNQNQDTQTTPRTRPATVTHATAGIGYVIDIIRWVPTLGVLVGGYRLGGGNLDGALYLPGVELAASLDYQFSRQWSAGIGFRETLFFTKISDYPSYITVLARVGYSWGY